MRRITGNNNFGGKDTRRDSHKEFSRGSSSEKKMHRVTCDKCGDSCEVPFRPTGNKPVYCSDCFRKNEKASSRNDEDYDDNYDNKKENSASNKNNQFEELNDKIDEMNDKIDKIMKILNID